MADTISRKALIEILNERDKNTCTGTITIEHAKRMVQCTPSLSGKWTYYSTTMQECSNCKRHTARHKFKFCPHCGAEMEDKYYEPIDR